MEHSPDPPAPATAIYEPDTALHFPSEEARIFCLRGAKDALSASARPAAAHPHLPPDLPFDLTREGEPASLVSTKLFAAWGTAPPPPDSPAQRHDARAHHGGFLDMLGREAWPAAISSPAFAGEGGQVEHGGGAFAAPDDGTDGNCQVRQLRRLFRLDWPAGEER